MGEGAIWMILLSGKKWCSYPVEGALQGSRPSKNGGDAVVASSLSNEQFCSNPKEREL